MWNYSGTTVELQWNYSGIDITCSGIDITCSGIDITCCGMLQEMSAKMNK